MDIFLYQGHYQSLSDGQYKSTQVYKFWLKQDGEKIIIKQQDDNTALSVRKYENINEFFNHWGLVFRDPKLIKKT